MSLLLAGLTVLVIGDSHMANEGYLISTLHDELMRQGASVYSYGVCGANAGDLMKGKKKLAHCGFAYRLNDGKVRKRAPDVSATTPYPELVKNFPDYVSGKTKAIHPDLVVVINADTMAGYKSTTLQKTWIWDEVTTLTKGIKDSGVSCVWVGPAWGSEGGKYGKTYARSQEMSDYLANIVSPCTYVNSLKMAQPGEWGTLTGDGQHYDHAGYQAWGSAIAHEIVTSDILQKIRR